MAIFKNGILENGNKRFKLNFAEEKPFLENLATRKKTYIHMIDISHFWWDENGIHWTLKLDRGNTKKTMALDRNGKETIDYQCDCSISSEKIDIQN